MPAQRSIVHVTGYYPPHLGGLEVVVQTVAQLQAKSGATVSVLTSDQGAKSGKTGSNPQVQRLWSAELAHTPWMPRLFSQLLKIEKNSIVHLHVAHIGLPEAVWLASKIRGFAYVAHMHIDIAPSGPLGALLKPYKKIVLTRVLKRASAVIVLSKGFGSMLESTAGVKSTIVPNGVDEQFFATVPKKKNAIPRLLFVGRLTDQKNIPLLLDALAFLKKPVHLQIVGDGNMRSEIEAAVMRTLSAQKNKSLGQLSTIQLLGAKSGAELAALYKQADLLVIPSKREGGVPLVALEAMAAKTPIVATDVIGNKDMADIALLVPSNPKAFAQGIETILSNKRKQQSMVKAGSALAKKQTWKNTIEKINEIYDTIKSK